MRACKKPQKNHAGNKKAPWAFRLALFSDGVLQYCSVGRALNRTHLRVGDYDRHFPPRQTSPLPLNPSFFAALNLIGADGFMWFDGRRRIKSPLQRDGVFMDFSIPDLFMLNFLVVAHIWTSYPEYGPPRGWPAWGFFRGSEDNASVSQMMAPAAYLVILYFLWSNHGWLYPIVAFVGTLAVAFLLTIILRQYVQLLSWSIFFWLAAIGIKAII